MSVRPEALRVDWVVDFVYDAEAAMWKWEAEGNGKDGNASNWYVGTKKLASEKVLITREAAIEDAEAAIAKATDTWRHDLKNQIDRRPFTLEFHR